MMATQTPSTIKTKIYLLNQSTCININQIHNLQHQSYLTRRIEVVHNHKVKAK